MSENLLYDICVIGGGSGGFGAACSAARGGANVLLIEAGPGVGGTSTWAGVNNYEPVAGATGLIEEVYERLCEIPDASALQFPFAKYHPDRPWGMYKLSEAKDYRYSLSRRSGVPITFEPQALDTVMRNMLEEANVTLQCDTRFTEVQHNRGRIQSITARSDRGETKIKADVYIDATADIFVARAAGCASAIGLDARDVYDEPSAPESAEFVLNNASLCYRVTPLKEDEPDQIQPPPDDIDLDAIRPVTSIRTYPNGDLNMNPVHLMSGVEAHDLGSGAYPEAQKRIQAHWHILQSKYDFNRWRLIWTSPMLGVRETHRLVGQYVLTEHDVDGGFNHGNHTDIIGFADHAIDFHGSRPSRELHKGPYGIPFRCLLTNEIENLIIACRGASFSSVAASTCRLSRTMMVLGQAAGTAAEMFGREIQNFNATELRQRLMEDGVSLELSAGYLDAMPDMKPLIDSRW